MRFCVYVLICHFTLHWLNIAAISIYGSFLAIVLSKRNSFLTFSDMSVLPMGKYGRLDPPGSPIPGLHIQSICVLYHAHFLKEQVTKTAKSDLHFHAI